jgi:hypothetical protein
MFVPALDRPRRIRFLKSHYCAVTFRKAPRRVQMVSPYTGQLTEFAGEQQWLAAGQGVLLKVN